jgi:hypothetical protein
MLAKEHHDLLGHLRPGIPFRLPETDREGWSRFQMWDLMKKLGPRFVMGCPAAFMEIAIDFPADEAKSEEPS